MGWRQAGIERLGGLVGCIWPPLHVWAKKTLAVALYGFAAVHQPLLGLSIFDPLAVWQRWKA